MKLVILALAVAGAASSAYAQSFTPAPVQQAQPSPQRLQLPLLELHPAGRHRRSRITLQGETVFDSQTAAGLDELLAGSEAAVVLARAAHRDLLTGEAIAWSGFGLALAGAVAFDASLIYFAATNVSNVPVFPISFIIGGFVLGAVTSMISVPFTSRGRTEEAAAVERYDDDLRSGRLRSPAVDALPQR